MAVNAALIALISPYTVGELGDFTAEDLTAYLAIATAKFNREDPGLPSTLADYAKGLLVCHFYESSKGKRTLKSESIGGYSYSKEESAATSYLADYQMLLADYGIEEVSAGIERTDKYVPDQFMVDQASQAEFHEEDETKQELGE
jgi:hypothetical protein